MDPNRLRSEGEVEDFNDLNDLYSPISKFNREKLPTYQEVLRLVNSYVNEGWSYDKAITQVSEAILEHWISRNVYPMTVQAIRKKLKKDVEEFRVIARTPKNKRKKSWLNRYRVLIAKKNKLYDVFCKDLSQRKKLESKYEIPMLEEDFKFLESMRTDRKAVCVSKVDIEWHQKEKEIQGKIECYIKRQSCSSVSMSSSEVLSDEEANDDVFDEIQIQMIHDDNYLMDIEAEPINPKKKFRYLQPGEAIHQISNIRTRSSSSVSTFENDSTNETSDDLPLKFRHIRKSERVIRDEVYLALAELDGHGFSYREGQLAIVVVANTLFGRAWKFPTEEDESEDREHIYDNDTLPTRKNIRKMLNNVEAYSMKIVGDKLMEAKESGATVTHATDSTTRKYVGSFAPAGLHLNNEQYLPLPTLPISSETTENVAASIALDFKLLEAASGHSAEELYSTVDVHMTDSTAHNKGISKILANTFDRENEAGQIFCDSHTVLGFDRGISKVLNRIEEKMGMTNIFNSFLLDVDIDQRKDTVAMSTVSWTLSLFGPDNINKPWNYYKDFRIYLEQKEKSIHLFLLKEARFGALSRSAAIMCYHWDDFFSFLSSHDYITNKLACLVRDALSLEYVKVVVSVVAIVGMQIITPYHAMTISKTATHSKLKVMFESLYEELTSKEINCDFFQLEQPAFSVVSQSLFKDVKENYGIDVVQSVKKITNIHMTDCISLAAKILPELASVLSMQRGKYYNFGEFATEYHVFDQCENIDLTPVHNLQMERQCGDTDQRLKKKPNINTVSRGTVLKETKFLRKDISSEYRSMGPVVKIMDNIKATWKKRQLELEKIGLTRKEAYNLHVENRKLNILEKLKERGGPFTSSEQIDDYLQSQEDDKAKINRLRDEVVYARDTSSSLPKANPVFRIFQTTEGRKRKMFTVEQFGNNLKILLGKKNQRNTVTLADFQKALKL